MSSASIYKCDRCKKEITGSKIIVSFESEAGLSRFEDTLDLCSNCYSDFIDWVKNTDSSKIGPVERAARREGSLESPPLGPVERVARREGNK